MNEYEAKAYFTISAPTEKDARAALQRVTDIVDDVLRDLLWDAGIGVLLSLEDPHGEVEEV